MDVTPLFVEPSLHRTVRNPLPFTPTGPKGHVTPPMSTTSALMASGDGLDPRDK
ncbi:hypothetical protein FRC00_004711, partial [Tulasnella sp. 408]